MSKVAIFIDSFDGYSDIWPTFFKIFDKYWGKCHYNKYLVTNEKSYSYKGLKLIKTGPEKNWFDRTLKALEQVKEDYIIFMLEDYFVSKFYNSDIINLIIERMQNENIYYYQLSGNSKLEKEQQFIQQKLEYPISLQLTIWHKEEFKKSVQEAYNNGAKTPWEFEKYFIDKFKDEKNCPKGVAYDTRDVMGYKNGVIQGKWYPKTINFYKRQDIVIDIIDRKVMTKNEVFKYESKVAISGILPTTLKNGLKKILRKFGFKFVI